MYRINEIFYSLQGEGYNTGTPAVFVRFSGCNLCCPFCDTDFADYTEMIAEEIGEEIHTLIHKYSTLNTQLSTSNTKPSTLNSNHSPLIILTGGEPALQVDEPLLTVLHATGMSVCIETNGTHALPDGIDWVTCSPKQGTRLALTRADELKVVLTEGTAPEQWLTQIQADHLFLQPCSCQNTEQVIDYILRHPHWRLSLQTHKYLHIR
ncbi:MAG: 4Fe-4S cluster-binding domain-containing protein [Paludibacteraceae bacterium]|nr:4Fe-4S cluster-binding domain-containing protein [Paludibacteraceae bacterium]